jgi:phage replication O-like protein O
MTADVIELNAPSQPESADRAQLENGYTRIANELLEALLLADLSKRELLVVMAIARKTYGFSKGFDRVAGSQIAQMTGLHVTHISQAKTRLIDSGILRTKGREIGINPVTSEWSGLAKTANKNKPQTLAKTANKLVSQNSYELAETANETLAKTAIHKRKKEIREESTSLRSVDVGDGCAEKQAEQDGQPQRCKAMPTPYDEILKAYREILVTAGMADVHGLSEPRKAQVKSFWAKRQAERRKADKPDYTVDNWRSYCKAIAVTPSLKWLTDPYQTKSGASKRSNIETILRESILDKVRDAIHQASGVNNQ